MPFNWQRTWAQSVSSTLCGFPQPELELAWAKQATQHAAPLLRRSCVTKTFIFGIMAVRHLMYSHFALSVPFLALVPAYAYGMLVPMRCSKAMTQWSAWVHLSGAVVVMMWAWMPASRSPAVASWMGLYLEFPIRWVNSLQMPMARDAKLLVVLNGLEVLAFSQCYISIGARWALLRALLLTCSSLWISMLVQARQRHNFLLQHNLAKQDASTGGASSRLHYTSSVGTEADACMPVQPDACSSPAVATAATAAATADPTEPAPGTAPASGSCAGRGVGVGRLFADLDNREVTAAAILYSGGGACASAAPAPAVGISGGVGISVEPAIADDDTSAQPEATSICTTDLDSSSGWEQDSSDWEQAIDEEPVSARDAAPQGNNVIRGPDGDVVHVPEQRSLLRYRPRRRWHQVALKLGHLEPEDISKQAVANLQHQLIARLQHLQLTAASVRRGCVQIVMELADARLGVQNYAATDSCSPDNRAGGLCELLHVETWLEWLQLPSYVPPGASCIIQVNRSMRKEKWDADQGAWVCSISSTSYTSPTSLDAVPLPAQFLAAKHATIHLQTSTPKGSRAPVHSPDSSDPILEAHAVATIQLENFQVVLALPQGWSIISQLPDHSCPEVDSQTLNLLLHCGGVCVSVTIEHVQVVGGSGRAGATHTPGGATHSQLLLVHLSAAVRCGSACSSATLELWQGPALLDTWRLVLLPPSWLSGDVAWDIQTLAAGMCNMGKEHEHGALWGPELQRLAAEGQPLHGWVLYTAQPLLKDLALWLQHREARPGPLVGGWSQGSEKEDSAGSACGVAHEHVGRDADGLRDVGCNLFEYAGANGKVALARALLCSLVEGREAAGPGGVKARGSNPACSSLLHSAVLIGTPELRSAGMQKGRAHGEERSWEEESEIVAAQLHPAALRVSLQAMVRGLVQG